MPAKNLAWKGGLHAGGSFFNDEVMPDPVTAPAPLTNTSAWNPDLIFPTLGDPVRRRLLLALARGGPQPGATLMGSAGRRLDATLKHLAAMRSAGLVVMQPDPTDRRRMCYALASSVPVSQTAGGVVMDFGFVLLRL
jgi:hypothetical protein